MTGEHLLGTAEKTPYFHNVYMSQPRFGVTIVIRNHKLGHWHITSLNLKSHLGSL